jgi:hypothetical protein
MSINSAPGSEYCVVLLGDVQAVGISIFTIKGKRAFWAPFPASKIIFKIS